MNNDRHPDLPILTPDIVATRAMEILHDRARLPPAQDCVLTATRSAMVKVTVDPLTIDSATIVSLNRHAECGFPVPAEDFHLPLDEFATKYLSTAMAAIASSIDREIRETAAARPIFACAELPLPLGVYGEVQTRDRLSMLTTYQYDITTMRTRMVFEVLFGVAASVTAPTRHTLV